MVLVSLHAPELKTALILIAVTVWLKYGSVKQGASTLALINCYRLPFTYPPGTHRAVGTSPALQYPIGH